MRPHNSRKKSPRRFIRVVLALSASAGALVSSTAAHATGFLTDKFGGDFGNPALGNVYSVYFNPAAMGAMSGSDVMLDGLAAARSVSFTRTALALSPSPGNTGELQNPTYVQANTGTATLFNVLASPYLGFVSDLGSSRWRLGAAVYVPFGGSVSWQKVQGDLNGAPGAPGAYDGPQRWSSISLTTSSIYETLALAYTLPESHLSFGISASVIETSIVDTLAHNADGSDDIITNGKVSEGRGYLNVSGVEVGAAAGVHWRPSPNWQFGLSYTSQPNFGQMRLSGTYEQYFGAGTSAADDKGDLLQQYPDIIRLGTAWRVAPEAELRLDFDYERWSVFKNQCVVNSGGSCTVASNGTTTGSVIVNEPRDFQDSYRARLGGAYWIEPETQIYGSAAVETSPVAPQYVDPLLFDSIHIQGSLGVRHEFSKHVYASLAYTYIYYVPITVTNSSLYSFKAPSTQPNEDGDYSAALYIFDGALGYHW